MRSEVEDLSNKYRATETMGKASKQGEMFLQWICVCCLFREGEALSLNFVKVARYIAKAAIH